MKEKVPQKWAELLDATRVRLRREQFGKNCAQRVLRMRKEITEKVRRVFPRNFRRISVFDEFSVKNGKSAEKFREFFTEKRKKEKGFSGLWWLVGLDKKRKNLNFFRNSRKNAEKGKRNSRKIHSNGNFREKGKTVIIYMFFRFLFKTEKLSRDYLFFRASRSKISNHSMG